MTKVLHLMFAGGAMLLRGSLVDPPGFRVQGLVGLGFGYSFAQGCMGLMMVEARYAIEPK